MKLRVKYLAMLSVIVSMLFCTSNTVLASPNHLVFTGDMSKSVLATCDSQYMYNSKNVEFGQSYKGYITIQNTNYRDMYITLDSILPFEDDTVTNIASIEINSGGLVLYRGEMHRQDGKPLLDNLKLAGNDMLGLTITVNTSIIGNANTVGIIDNQWMFKMRSKIEDVKSTVIVTGEYRVSCIGIDGSEIKYEERIDELGKTITVKAPDVTDMEPTDSEITFTVGTLKDIVFYYNPIVPEETPEPSVEPSPSVKPAVTLSPIVKQEAVIEEKTTIPGIAVSCFIIGGLLGIAELVFIFIHYVLPVIKRKIDKHRSI